MWHFWQAHTPQQMVGDIPILKCLTGWYHYDRIIAWFLTKFKERRLIDVKKVVSILLMVMLLLCGCQKQGGGDSSNDSPEENRPELKAGEYVLCSLRNPGSLLTDKLDLLLGEEIERSTIVIQEGSSGLRFREAVFAIGGFSGSCVLEDGLVTLHREEFNATDIFFNEAMKEMMAEIPDVTYLLDGDCLISRTVMKTKQIQGHLPEGSPADCAIVVDEDEFEAYVIRLFQDGTWESETTDSDNGQKTIAEGTYIVDGKFVWMTVPVNDGLEIEMALYIDNDVIYDEVYRLSATTEE